MNTSKLNLKAIAIAFLATAIIPSVAHTATPPADTTQIRQARDEAAGRRTHITSLLMKDIVEQAQIDDELSFLDDVRNSEHISGKPLSVLQAEHPFLVTAAEVSALNGGAYFTSEKLMAPIFNGPASNFVTRILQKFPKTTKSAPWVVSLSVAAYQLYKTIQHTSVYTQYKNMSPTSQTNFYNERLDRFHAVQIDRAALWEQLQQTNEELSYFDEQIAKRETKFVK